MRMSTARCRIYYGNPSPHREQSNRLGLSLTAPPTKVLPCVYFDERGSLNPSLYPLFKLAIMEVARRSQVDVTVEPFVYIKELLELFDSQIGV